MSKLIKLFLFLVFPLFLLLGGAYGLAKVGVIPVRKMAGKNKAAKAALHLIGLDSPKLPAVQVAAPHAPVGDPLEAQHKELAADRAAFEKQRADWEAQKQAATKATPARAADPRAATDPKSITRLATVYEQMDPATANKIFTKLPDPEVIQILRKMDEKKVGQILAIVPPDRAARMTLALSKPAAPATPPAETQ
jgi:flagellar motility protein MotE (MotC chaperone)